MTAFHFIFFFWAIAGARSPRRCELGHLTEENDLARTHVFDFWALAFVPSLMA
jgi:hypothetical protein